MKHDSKFEQDVYLTLIELGYVPMLQVSFKELVGCGGEELRFDFGLYLSDKPFQDDPNLNRPDILIEVQGKQHYSRVVFNGKPSKIGKQRIHDRRKREFCMLNDIQLIEIPYWELDIKTYLRSKGL